MATVREKYNAVSKRYNLMELPAELTLSRRWREDVQDALEGPVILEVGVSTGKNIPYYPPEWRVIAFDLGEGMLDYIDERHKQQTALLQMDAEQMGFPDAVFDSAFDTFVFCSVPDPRAGLREIYRVLKTGGRFVALEHMRPNVGWAGALFDLTDPVMAGLSGVQINRRTVENIRSAGFRIEEVRYLMTRVFRLILARKSEHVGH